MQTLFPKGNFCTVCGLHLSVEKRQLLSGSKSILNFDFGMDGRWGMEKEKFVVPSWKQLETFFPGCLFRAPGPAWNCGGLFTASSRELGPAFLCERRPVNSRPSLAIPGRPGLVRAHRGMLRGSHLCANVGMLSTFHGALSRTRAGLGLREGARDFTVSSRRTQPGREGSWKI